MEDIERLCQTALTETNRELRLQAENKLNTIISIQNVPQLQITLANSQNQQTLHYMAKSLINLVTTNWKLLNIQQKIAIRNMGLSFLANRYNISKPILILICELIARITKLGWVENEELTDITTQASKFFTSAQHLNVGFLLYTTLVHEIDTMFPTHTLSYHRKIAIAFRDNALTQIFALGVNFAKQIKSIPENMRKDIADKASELCFRCLSYDFIGTSPDDSIDEIGTIQIPKTWKNYFEEDNILNHFFELYSVTKSHSCLRCLGHIAATRITLFTTTVTKNNFLEMLIKGLGNVMSNNIGLNEVMLHHEFCRLLTRLKSNFPMKLIVSTQAFKVFLPVLTQFTIQTFQSWQFSPHSIYYLLELWREMIKGSNFVEDNDKQFVCQFAGQLVQSYTQSRIQSVSFMISNDSIEDPLENENLLEEEIKSLPPLMRCQYEPISIYLKGVFEPIAKNFLIGVQAMGNNSPQKLINPNQLSLIEGQLTWVVYMIGCAIGGKAHINSSDEQHSSIDAELSALLFQLLNAHNQRLSNSNLCTEKYTERLEIALLKFIQHFRKVFISENNATTHSIFPRLEKLVGIGSFKSVLNVMLIKICENLKYWATNKHIIRESLDLFNNISTGYSSAKIVRETDTILKLFSHHTSQYFPFLDYPKNTRCRSTFYNTISRLLFLDSSGCTSSQFNNFMKPFSAYFNNLLSINNPNAYKNEQVRHLIIGLLRDFRGIVDAIFNKRAYNMLFDWIIESKSQSGQLYIEIFSRIASVFYDDPHVTTPLFKFLSELCFSKSSRIKFDSSSPNGILLFRYVSETIVAYGSKIANFKVPSDREIYDYKYKGTWLCLQTLSRCLTGCFCNFGVFTLYKDPALDNALNTIFHLLFSVDTTAALKYPKFASSCYSFLESISTEHTSTLSTLDDRIFEKVIYLLQIGVDSKSVLNQNVCTSCCTAIDRIIQFYVDNLEKETYTAQCIKKHFNIHANTFNNILKILFTICLNDECQYVWSISRPMLGLIIINPKFFSQLQQEVISMYKGDTQVEISNSLQELMKDIELNLTSSNRDQFTKNLTNFRNNIKKFLIT